MANKTLSNKNNKYVLVFNNLKRFVAVFRSCTATAKAFNVSPTIIHLASTGKIMSSHNYYFRYCDNFNLNELDDMSVIDWDIKNGLQRDYYSNGKMSRTGRVYKKTKEKIKVIPKKPKIKERITREMIIERIRAYKKTT